MNLIVEKDGIVVLTDVQAMMYDNVHVGKGAVFATVPDTSTAAERVETARDLWATNHPSQE